jgi:caffeoyl-CoA O-methyltransferase
MDARVANVIRRAEEFIAQKDDALAIPRAAGEFVHALLLASNAKRCLEIGTSYGYSGLWIAAAMKANDGHLVTIDREQRKSDVAAAHFADAGLGHVVRLETGVALDALGRVDGPFDFVLVDADKENCINYVQRVEAKLNPRAIVLTDNTLTHGEQLAPFLGWIRNHARFQSAHVPVGNGMEMSVRV